MGAHMALRTGKDGQLGPSWRRGGAMGELHPGVAGVGVQGPEQDESGTASTGWVFSYGAISKIYFWILVSSKFRYIRAVFVRTSSLSP